MLLTVLGTPVSQRTQQYILAAVAAGLVAAALWLGVAAFNTASRSSRSPVPARRGSAGGAAAARLAGSQAPSHSASAKSLSGFTNGFPRNPPKTLSQAQIHAVKLPKGFVLAQVPWKRDSSQPVPAFVALARLPWRFDSSHPVPAFVALASLPWADCQVLTLHLPHPPQRWGIPDCRFVMALCRDRRGNLWMATEGSGVFRYDPAAPKTKQWMQFTKQNTQGQLANNNIYALACDNRGRIWAGELNHGVSVYNGSHWQNYDIVQNPKHKVLAGPLGNHVFALKFDKFTNQMWICTDAGISIYQCSARASASPGQPAGINPAARQTVTGDLSPVVFTAGTWHYITQANGLPQNPDCIAFNPNGTVYVGTQCGGIAIATSNEQRATNNISHIATGFAGGGVRNGARPLDPQCSNAYRWRVVRGPWKMPLTATGSGLPSNLINAIAIAPNGTLVAGTDGGIAFATGNETLRSASNDQRTTANTAHIATGFAGGTTFSQAGVGAISQTSAKLTWTFMRGQDFPAKVLGLWHPPKHWQAPSPETLESLPMEDYTTALALNVQRSTNNEQQAGRHRVSQFPTPSSLTLWLGHRQRGIDVWQYNSADKITKRVQIHEPQIGNYITSLLPLPGGAMAVGTYGKGVCVITLPGASDKWKHPAGKATDAVVPEPHGAAPPTRRQLASLAAQLAETLKTASHKQPAVVALGDDWRTQGSWLGRYGRYWACLFASRRHPPSNYVWGPASRSLHFAEGMGPHVRNGDSVRLWTQWLLTDNLRSLELPAVYLGQCVATHTASWKMDRRESELDDHGEDYPSTWQGPGLYLCFHVPSGEFTLSLYFFNPNGHITTMRYRDYAVSAIPLPSSYHFGNWRHPHTASLANMRGIANSRTGDFCGGVWKRLLVRGPAKLAISISKNYSFNTIISGAFLDPLAEHPAPYYYGYRAWQIRERKRAEFRTRLAAAWRSQQLPDDPSPAAEGVGLATARQIMQILNVLEHRAPAAWAANQRLAYLSVLRWCVARPGNLPKGRQAAKIAEKCYYHLAMFGRWEFTEKTRGIVTSRKIEKALRWDGLHEDYRGYEFSVIRRASRRLQRKGTSVAEN